MSWVELDRNASPTKGATDLATALPGSINLGQGREIDNPKGEIGQLLRGEITFDTPYHGAVGGSMKLRENVAQWTKDFLGIEAATGANTFVIQVLGRGGLREGFSLASQATRAEGVVGNLLVPNYSWPMVTSLAKREGLRPAFYDITNPDLPGEIRTQMNVAPAQGRMVGLYQGNPANPTGRHTTVDEGKAINAIMDESDMWAIHDNPYFMACKRSTGGGAFLETGFRDNVLAADAKTPWIHVMSGSKGLASANNGLHVLVVHPRYSAALNSQLLETGIGLSYNPSLYSNLTEFFQPKHYEATLDHFEMLGNKYRENYKHVQQVFGMSVIDGGPCMTSLVTVSKSIFGRTIPCHDGQQRKLLDVNDIVEILGNGVDDSAKGAIVVNNGTDKVGNGLIRIAQAQHADKFQEGVSRVQRGLDLFMNA